MDWLLGEYTKDKTIFGVNRLYRHEGTKTLPIFGERLETPFGVAAGPHSQLAQNIISAYAAGARFFELKTVQKMDGEALSKCVAKPCILAEDECYNVEWSTELYVPLAMDEYIKAWFAIKLISRELALGEPDGFVFNMSVGYDLAGIKTQKIDSFIEGLKNAADTESFKSCMDWTLANLSRFNKLDESYIKDIKPHVCQSVTISTLHGCPPEEIERIAAYLISEKNLNTFIKCNPTLLGYDFARKAMDDMGYSYVCFDDHHFKDDLQFCDAVPMFRRLQSLAEENHVEFGLKLSNTLPVKIEQGELPGAEMYMSGRALYALTVNLAKKLEEEFSGALRISYCGGADQLNCGELFSAGLWPVTVATTLLKPGGYNRLYPMAELAAKCEYRPFIGVDMERLSAIAEDALKNPRYTKPLKPRKNTKLIKKLPLKACFAAPCREGCPIHQDIPAYISLVGEGRFASALEVICRKNPLPHITGTICSHRCMTACTRNFYEESVSIRDTKLLAAQKGFEDFLPTLVPKSKLRQKIAVIGGGAAGMAAAFLAAREGAQVTIFEKRDALGGIVRHVIPEFRIPASAIDNDVKLLEQLGVKIRLNTGIDDAPSLLSQGYSHVIIAVGAWQHGELKLQKGRALNVLEFLEKAKKAPTELHLGKNVAVIGGGNTAMDAARAALRMSEVEHVRIIYRRTCSEMPADLEELELCIAEGIEFSELSSPVSLDCGVLLCEKMCLGEPDSSGRCAPVPTGEFIDISADTVISAIGESVDTAYLEKAGVPVTERKLAKQIKNGSIFVVGDGFRGPSTVVECIADAAAAVDMILGTAASDVKAPLDEICIRKARSELHNKSSAEQENLRCLNCEALCESCVDVCPNRANISVIIDSMEMPQIIHLDRLCNECGNCGVFCPYEGSPYKDKLTVFANEDDLVQSDNNGFVLKSNGRLLTRLNGELFETDKNGCGRIGEIMPVIHGILNEYPYLL